jgi:acetyl-CoA acetyltransferase
MAATAAIAGLGITEMGKVYGRTASDFAAEALALALEDAGLDARDVDHVLVSGNGGVLNYHSTAILGSESA